MDNLEALLERWQEAAVIDPAIAGRIRTFEAQRETKRSWAVITAIVFGCVMVAAGILLFVAAHWDGLSPTQRFLLVITKVALFHVAGAFFARRSPDLSLALHMIGTIALGAGIFLAGQIFNLEEHWPGGIMLWAIGAAVAWWILRDWAQGMLVALLVPFWLFGEWEVRVGDMYHRGDYLPVAFLLGLAVTYFTASQFGHRSALRRALTIIGALGIVTLVPALIFSSWDEARWGYWLVRKPLPLSIRLTGWAFSLVTPLLLAWTLRGRKTWQNALAAVWIWTLSQISRLWEPDEHIWFYGWSLIGCIGLIYWGVNDRRKERINLGMAGFAVTIIAFYFSEVLDKYGRSTVLISMGIIFLVGGYYMERLRRRLISHVSGGAQ
jgi:uncharacterized membrane protein